ncbi:MAG TPA: glycosyltransferase, partial [Euzebya sp.]|nr:glycosyltransferase [Euzebya sp.]
SSDLRAAWELYRALRGIRPHVLHTHTPKAGILGRVIGRMAGVPVVVNTCHGLWATREDRWVKRALVIGAEVVASQFSDAELYQNDDDRQRLSRWVRQSKVKTVGNGIDLQRFRRDEEGRARVRAEWGIGPDEVVVGGVGRRVAEKGIAEFGHAARALADKARFVWVGPDDPDKPDALREAEEGVHFVGFRDDMPAVYSAFDIFCLPSYREGFSRSAMEAAACGCALVLSDIRGCRELGSHGKDLLLVAAGDPAGIVTAADRLIMRPDLRASLGDAIGRRAAASFDQRQVASCSWNTYRRVGQSCPT